MGLEQIPAILDLWFGTPAADATALGGKMRRWFVGGPAMNPEIIARFWATTEAAIEGWSQVVSAPNRCDRRAVGS